MHHAVAYGINLVERFDDANLRVGEEREDELHALCVLRDVVHDLLFLSRGELHFHECAVKSHTLCSA